jgi:hypothetical protein
MHIPLQQFRLPSGTLVNAEDCLAHRLPSPIPLRFPILLSMSSCVSTMLPPNSTVQNEVAAMSLGRRARAPRQIIPAIYGWASAAKGQVGF